MHALYVGVLSIFVQFADIITFDLNHLSSYLAYNGFIDDDFEYRFFSTMSKERCDEFSKEFIIGDTTHGHPVHLSKENVENWYPKTFSKKIDLILLYLYQHISYMGEQIKLSKETWFSWLFVNRYQSQKHNRVKLADDALKLQADYMINFLLKVAILYVHLIGKVVTMIGRLLYRRKDMGE